MLTIYKLIIADDELGAREILKKYITDFCKNFEIVGMFDDGAKALEFIKNNYVDLVFTDVRMPKVTGIELSEYIYENIPHIKVVIVSGYNDFRYAQQAVKYNVEYYLLKAIDADEFFELMNNIEKKLDNTKITAEKDYRLIDSDLFFSDLIGGYFSTLEETKNSYEDLKLNINFDETYCEIIKLKFGNFLDFVKNIWHHDMDMFKITLRNVVKLLHNDFYVLPPKIVNDTCVIASFHKKSAVNISESTLLYELMDVFKINSKTMNHNVYSLYEIYEGNFDFIFENSQQSNVENTDQPEYDMAKNLEIIKKSEEFIHNNYQKSITRVDIAQNVYLNNVYLGRIFKNATGKTLLEYLVDVRMKKSIELLKNGEKAEIVCVKVGYKDLRSFRRSFKRYTGFSISEYRSANSNESYGNQNEK